MVKKEQSKRQKSIRSKLMAAVCMLLVSAIMMVSSTYAWFTLSTAPEVTGINTSVGANGNLEMALLPEAGVSGLNTIGSAAGDSMSSKDKVLANLTWGNLVDLDDPRYGLDQIHLYPATLNLGDDGKLPVTGSLLSTPEYGADGRVTGLVEKTVTGYYSSSASNFAQNDKYGVRAVGVASGMTDRQLSYRNARAAASTAMGMAKTIASQSLNANGSALANIAIEYGMGADTASFDAADVAALRAIVNSLNGEGGVLEQIETAYMQYILAIAASATTGTEDTAWTAVKGLVEASDATLDTVQAGLSTAGVTLPSELTDAITAYESTVSSVSTADTKLQALESRLDDETTDNDTFEWAEIKEAMEPLANPAAMQINGFKASEVKENLGGLVSSVTTQGGLKVTIASGGGVYADIADQCGNFNASVNIARVEYNGIVLENMAARMETAGLATPYLTAIGTVVTGAGAPSGGNNADMPFSEMYGYIIDLAFRTNAAESNLLLQPQGIDRIYDENSNPETMGHGASMTFATSDPDFSNDQVKALMSAIRIVFFNPADGTIYSLAKLDVDSATLGGDGWTAEMYLYTNTDTDGETEKTDNVLMPLTQNTATALSVLVYLEGAQITNEDVATGSTSMTGTMNLQFASSANLVPMEYAGLHTPATPGTGSGDVTP